MHPAGIASMAVRVEIGDDVEVGACTTIDRGTFKATRVGAGTKIDNLVQVGHNCQIGAHNLFVSQVGIAGSCTTGDHVVIAGQAGVIGHLHLGAGAVVGGQSGVTKDVPAGQRVLGTPATPERDQQRIMVSLLKLPEIRKDLLSELVEPARFGIPLDSLVEAGRLELLEPGTESHELIGRQFGYRFSMSSSVVMIVEPAYWARRARGCRGANRHWRRGSPPNPWSLTFAVIRRRFNFCQFTEIIWHICLTLAASVRYNPALLLGQVLGQKRERWHVKSTA